MRTNFAPDLLADPHLADAEKNLRACVHCGICTATCPTYVLLGDERDGPRGRIVMMQRMLEEGGPPSPETVQHIDRCLSCLGCRTACPSGVDYAALIDTSRIHIEKNYRRPVRQRVLRWTVANVLTRPALAKFAVALARTFAPVATRLPGVLGRLAATATKTRPQTANTPAVQAPKNAKRIALLSGCVQPALSPDIDRAAARVLARRGYALVPLEGSGCCGALPHHLGRDGKSSARHIIETFERADRATPFDGILITATGCAAHLAEYPRLFADEPGWCARAEAFTPRLRDFSMLASPRPASPPQRLRVALHKPCSQQHGLRVDDTGAALVAAGYDVVQIPESHLCCGSAGSYSILQPELADALRARKLGNAMSVAPDAIAAANIGCLNHLAGPDAPPLVHPAELIDWAEGGPLPAALAEFVGPARNK